MPLEEMNELKVLVEPLGNSIITFIKHSQS